MEIKTKFNVGDKLFFIGYNSFEKHEKCLACDGLGRIILRDGDTTYCPKCHEKGYVEIYGKENWHVLGHEDIIGTGCKDLYKRPVGRIHVEVSKNNVEIKYCLKGTGNLLDEKDSFGTLEEAQEECEKRNRGL